MEAFAEFVCQPFMGLMLVVVLLRVEVNENAMLMVEY